MKEILEATLSEDKATNTCLNEFSYITKMTGKRGRKTGPRRGKSEEGEMLTKIQGAFDILQETKWKKMQ